MLKHEIGRALHSVGRVALGLGLAAMAAATPAFGQRDIIGEVTIAEGEVSAFSGGSASALGDDGFASGEVIGTESGGFANVTLRDSDLVRVGPGARLVVEAVRSQVGEEPGSAGGLRLGLLEGGILFDRPEGAEETPIVVETAFGTLRTTNAEFFAGPEREGFAVFVEEGEVEFEAGGETIVISEGQGVSIAKAGDPPGPLESWGEPRITAAFASLGLDEVPLEEDH